jgi:hypothetical protein
MAKSDSTFTKRAAPKQRKAAGIGGIPEPIKQIGSDILAGIGEIKRQSGAAVQNVKSGYQRIKQAIKP